MHVYTGPQYVDVLFQVGKRVLHLLMAVQLVALISTGGKVILGNVFAPVVSGPSAAL